MLNKSMAKFNKEEKKMLLLATQQEVIRETLLNTATNCILQGEHLTIERLYDKFLSGIISNTLTDEEVNAKVQELITYISLKRADIVAHKIQTKVKEEESNE